MSPAPRAELSQVAQETTGVVDGSRSACGVRMHPDAKGRGAVTVFVLLLLMGGVDARSSEAFARAAHELAGHVRTAEELRVAGTHRNCPQPLPVVHVEKQAMALLDLPLDLPPGAVPERSVVDGSLPAPRAPDANRVG